MDAHGFVMAVLAMTLITMAGGFLFMDVATNMGSSQEHLDMEVFNKTNEILELSYEQQNETGFLEDVPIIGDIVALVGSGFRAVRLITSVPEIYMNAIAELTGYIGIPDYIVLIITAIIMFTVAYIFITAALRYKA